MAEIQRMDLKKGINSMYDNSSLWIYYVCVCEGILLLLNEWKRADTSFKYLKGAYEKMETVFLRGQIVVRQRATPLYLD